jgi:hypothetical protein
VVEVRPFEATEREQQVLSWIAAALGILGLCVIVATNLTGSWWILAGWGVLMVGTLCAVTAWLAKRHRLGLIDTVVAIARQTRRS